MIYIRFFSDFCTSEQAGQNYANVYCDGQLKNDHFAIVSDDTYTHVILLNKATPALKAGVVKSNVLGFALEPREFLNINNDFIVYVQKYCGAYFIGKSEGLPPPFKEHYSFMWFAWERKNYFSIKSGEKNLEKTYPKKGLMSIWCSDKYQAFGHKYRHTLIQEILRRKLPIDIWGRGCRFYSSPEGYISERLKGNFENEEPYKDYKYCISIENFSSECYISEKFTNCLAFNTVPVYYGASDIGNIFGEKSFIRLVGDIKRDIETIEGILKDDQNSKSFDLSEARKELFEGKGSFMDFIKNYWK